MSSTTFTDQVTPVVASWLNDVNTNIYGVGTSLTGLPLVAGSSGSLAVYQALGIAGGGTGGTSAATARAALSAAISGANNDITSLTALTAGGLPDNSVLTADIANAQVTPAKLSQPLTAGTAVSATGSSTIQFTGIPSWVKRVTVIMSGLSTSGTTNYQLQIGAGSFVTSGYAAGYANIDGTNATSAAGVSTSFPVKTAVSASATYSGIALLSYIGSNTWVCTSQMNSGGGVSTTQSGTLTLGGALDRVQLTADTFDAGTINILYE
jgi:hypothetical protein